MNMVEKLARAMCDAAEPRRIADQIDAPCFDDSRPDVQQYWMAMARDSLKALRDPSNPNWVATHGIEQAMITYGLSEHTGTGAR